MLVVLGSLGFTVHLLTFRDRFMFFPGEKTHVQAVVAALAIAGPAVAAADTAVQYSDAVAADIEAKEPGAGPGALVADTAAWHLDAVVADTAAQHSDASVADTAAQEPGSLPPEPDAHQAAHRARVETAAAHRVPDAFPAGWSGRDERLSVRRDYR